MKVEIMHIVTEVNVCTVHMAPAPHRMVTAEGSHKLQGHCCSAPQAGAGPAASLIALFP